MPEPNDTRDMPQHVALLGVLDGQLNLSTALVKLMVSARSNYDWPAGTGAAKSQNNIRVLEVSVADRLAALSAHSAHSIIIDISRWANNNTKSQANIECSSVVQREEMRRAISNLVIHGPESGAIDTLCKLPGISLVIASKIYRFCAPKVGAAVDRHASYFFNSLPIINHGKASHFVREWSTGSHTTSRLATYTYSNYERNRTEYIENYLPLLVKIAFELNTIPAPYKCAAINMYRNWTPADVEMAAYYWWASHGSR